ncbi:hypothetical protein ACIREE_05035 [Streptomyces sp. NPDC102467]|uniref:hypothetical protein n=1 Tax=Streptomyces sp. NPDC102467 TaxID=3366179 RepID=UPI003801A1DF
MDTPPGRAATSASADTVAGTARAVRGTVRSLKRLTCAVKPAAVMGRPMISGDGRPSAVGGGPRISRLPVVIPVRRVWPRAP